LCDGRRVRVWYERRDLWDIRNIRHFERVLGAYVYRNAEVIILVTSCSICCPFINNASISVQTLLRYTRFIHRMRLSALAAADYADSLYSDV